MRTINSETPTSKLLYLRLRDRNRDLTGILREIGILHPLHYYTDKIQIRSSSELSKTRENQSGDLLLSGCRVIGGNGAGCLSVEGQSGNGSDGVPGVCVLPRVGSVLLCRSTQVGFND